MGAISIVIECQPGRSDIIKNIMQLNNYFKYHELFSYNNQGQKSLRDQEDRYVCVVSLFDLQYCIPIFNTKKVDGIGVRIITTCNKSSEEYGYLDPVVRADFILSNYEDNVFFVDGVHINTYKYPVGSSILIELEKMVSLKVVYRKGAMASKKELKASGYSGVNYTSTGKFKADGTAGAKKEKTMSKSDWMLEFGQGALKFDTEVPLEVPSDEDLTKVRQKAIQTIRSAETEVTLHPSENTYVKYEEAVQQMNQQHI